MSRCLGRVLFVLLALSTLFAAPLHAASGIYRATVLADNPVGYYPLDETTGTTAFDIAGTNHGTYNGGVLLDQAGALGSGAPSPAFDGASGYVQLPGNWGGGTAVTVEAWVFVDNPNGTQAIIAATTADFVHLQAGGFCELHIDGGQQNISGVPDAPPAWHHVALVVTSGNSRLYVDGVQTASNASAFTAIDLASSVRIGAGQSPGRFLNGRIDEVAIYNFALSPARISAHYAAQADGPFTTVASGNWSSAATWTNGLIPSSGDDVQINGSHTVTVDLPSLSVGDLAVFGVLDLSSNGLIAAGDVTLAGTINGTTALNLTGTTGSQLIGLGTINAPVYFDTGSREIPGGESPDLTNTVTVAGTVLNNGEATLTHSSGLNGGGTWTQGSTGTLHVEGQITVSTFNASAPGNVVDYTGSNQAVRGVVYDNLHATGNGEIRYLGGVLSINGDFLIQGEFRDEGYQITGPGSSSGKTLSMAFGSVLQIGTSTGTQPASGTSLPDFQTYTLDPSSTIEYEARANQNVAGIAYANLGVFVSGFPTVNVTKTATGDVSTGGNLTVDQVNSTVVFDLSTYNLDIAGDLAGAGDINDNGPGVVTLQGHNTAFTGSITPSYDLTFAGTLNPQNIRATTYGTLTIDKTLSTAKLAGNATAGNITIDGGILDDNGFVLTGGGGTLTMSATASLTLYSSMPSMSVYALDPDSTVLYAADGNQVVSIAPAYGLLWLATGTTNAIKSLDAIGILYTTDLYIQNGPGITTLDATGNSVDVDDDFLGNGQIDLTNGFLYIGGDYTNTGALIGTNTVVSYDGSGPQVIRGTAYGDLLINKTGGSVGTLAANASVAGTFDVNNGTFDLATYTLDTQGYVEVDDTLDLGTGLLKIAGDFNVNGTVSAGTAAIWLMGPVTHQWSGTASTLALSTLVLDGSGGMEVQNGAGYDITISNSLALNGGGDVILNAPRKLTIGSTGSLTRVAGEVRGMLGIHIPAGQTRRFETAAFIADTYSPIEITSTNAAVINVFVDDSPATQKVDRVWTLSGDPSTLDLKFEWTYSGYTGDTRGFVPTRYFASTWSFPAGYVEQTGPNDFFARIDGVVAYEGDWTAGYGQYLGEVVPSIGSFDPVTGASGTSVTLYGSNFTGTTAVAFNGVNDPGFSQTTDNELYLTVPAGATTGTISVTNASGTGASFKSFTVAAPTTVQTQTSGAWSSPGTWLGGLVPNSWDNVIINIGHNVVLDVNATVNDLQLNANLSGGSNLELDGILTWNSGAISADVHVDSAAAVNVVTAGTHDLSGGYLDNDGTITISGATLYLSNGAEVQNDNLIDMAGDVGLVYSGAGAQPSIENRDGGAIIKTAGAGTSALGGGAELNNLGLIRAASGSLQITSDVTTENAILVESRTGGRFDVTTNPAIATQSFEVANGATLQFTSGGTFETGTDFTGAGTILITCPVEFEGNITASATSFLIDANAAITFSGAVFTGDVDWKQGAFTGTLNNALGSTIDLVAGPGVRKLDNLVLTNVGTINVGANVVMSNGATINNSDSVNFTGDHNITFDAVGAEPAIVNNGAGIVDKLAGAGTATVAVPLTSFTTIRSKSGTLRLEDSYSISAAVVALNAGTQVEFPGANGTNGTFNDNTTFSGSGMILVNPVAGSTVVVDGDLFQTAAAARIDTSSTVSWTSGAVLHGSMEWKDATFAGPGLQLASGSAVDIISGAGNVTLDGLALINNGTLTLAGASLALQNGASIDNQSTIEIGGDYDLRHNGAGAPGSIANSMVVHKTAGTGFSSLGNGAAITNSGTIQADAGTLSVSSAITSSGTINAATGAKVEFPATAIFNSGTNFAGLGTVDVFSNATFSGAINAGLGTTVIRGANTMTFNAATWSGPLVWKEATVTGSGLTMDAGSVLTIDPGTGTPTIDAGSVTIGGNAVFNDDFGLRNGASFIVNSGATAGIAGDYTWGYDGVGALPVVGLSGNFGKTAGTGTATMSCGGVCTNTATGNLAASAGTLAIISGLTNAGTIKFDIEGPTPFTDFGRIAVSGGTLALGGAATAIVDGAYDPSPGTAFQVMTFTAKSGDFTTKNYTFDGIRTLIDAYGANDLTLTASGPIIGSLTPSSGSELGGDTVVIAGSGFTNSPAPTVTFDGINATTVTFDSPTQLTAVTPAHAAGAVDVVVTNSSSEAYTSIGGFTFTAASGPTVTNIRPNSGNIAGGTTVYLDGTDLDTVTGVTFDGFAATIVNQSATLLELTTPGHVAGAVPVVVTNPGGTANTTFTYDDAWDVARDFSKTANPTGPWSYGQTPTRGGAFTAFTQTGTSSGLNQWNYLGAEPLVFHNATASTITVSNLVAPAGAFAMHPGASQHTAVRWTAPYAGQWQISGSFTGIDQAPTTVDVAVLVGGVQEFQTLIGAYNTPQNFSLSRTLANGEVVEFTVDNFNGYFSDATRLAATITPLSGPTVTITNVVPAIGPTTGNQLVTISGTNFHAGAGVTFDGVSATGVTAVNGSTITATTPAHAAGTVDVTVTHADSADATASGAYTYSGDPHWINAGGGSWNNAANWSTGVVPSVGQTAYIDAVGTYTVTFNGADHTIGALSVASGATLDVASNTLTISGNSTVDLGGSLVLSGGTLAGSGTVTINGGMDWSGGTLATNVVVSGGRTLQISGAGTKSVVTGAYLTNNGTVTVNGTGPIGGSSGAGAVIDNNGTWNHNADAHFQRFSTPSTVGTFNNAGTFNKSGAALTTFDPQWPFNSSGGSINVDFGTLRLDQGGSAPGGAYTIASGATLTFGGNFTASAPASFTGAGTVDFAGGTSTLSNSTVQNITFSGGTGAFTGPTTATTVTLAGGTFSGTGALTATGTGNSWSGGTLAAALTIDTGAVLAVTGSGTKSVSSGAALTNNGTVTVSGTGPIGGNSGANAVIDNNGTWNHTVDAHFQRFSTPSTVGTFNNAGTFTKSGAGLTTFDPQWPFNSSGGAVNVNAGTLKLDQGGSATGGTYTIASGATLSFGNSFTASAPATFTGAGTLDFLGGISSISGSTVQNVAFNGGTGGFTAPTTSTTLTLNGGAFSGAGSLTVTGSGNSWTGGTLAAPLTVDTGATLAVSGSGTKNVAAGAYLTNNGTVTVSGTGTIGGNSGAAAVFDNNGAWNHTADVAFQRFSSPSPVGTFNNAGTFTKSGTGTTAFDPQWTFNNSGTLTIAAGTLSFSEPFTQMASGALNLAANGTVAGSQYSRITSTNAVTLDGTLNLTIGYGPTNGDLLQILTFASRTGDFATKTGLGYSGGSFTYAANATDITLTATATSTAVSIAKSAPANVAANEPFSYTITVTNSGPNPATSVSVSDAIQAGMAPSNVVAPSFTCSGTGTLTCTAASLAVGAHTITFDVTAPSTPQAITNVANLSAANDSTGGDNSASAITNVGAAQADLAVTTSPSSGSVLVTSSFSWTSTVTNNGPSPATNVVLTNTLPAGQTVTGTSPSTGSCNTTGSVVTCTFGTLGIGGSANVVITVTADEGGTRLDQAVASANETDPNNTNDVGTATVTVNGASSMVVTTSNPGGTGSLFQALLDADSGVCVSPCTITFNIPVPAPIAGPLPTADVLDLTIDATTQPGYAGTPLIEIDGTSATPGTNGLDVDGDNHVIKGLAIYGFSGGAGINVIGGSHTFEENWIGLRANGTASANGTGILVNSSGNAIGHVNPALGNVISGNSGHGVRILFGSNTVEGNRIGTAADGVTPRGNGGSGVRVEAPASNGIVTGNTIAQNAAGIDVVTSTGVVIIGNSIHSNTGMAIDHDGDGVVETFDAGDGDGGSNGHQNSPSIASVEITPSDLDVTLSVDSSGVLTTNSLRVEVFKADPSGEPQTLLGTQCFGGRNLINQLMEMPIGPVVNGSSIVATATSFSDGACTAGNDGTSEVSTAVTAGNCVPPAVAITGPAAVCASTPVSLDAGGGHTTYLWSPGGFTGQILNVTPTSTTTYTVTVTDASGCANSDSHTVTVNIPAPVAITGPAAICNGSSVTLNATAGFTTYLWQPGNLGGSSITVSPTTTTTYTLTATDSNGCQSSTTHNVTVNTPAPASITPGGPTTFCAGGSVTLTASAGSSYLWSPNGETTPSISATASGSYSVTVTDVNGCVSTSAAVPVTVNPTPAVAITGPSTSCESASVTLNATGGFTTYLWQPGNLSGSSITVAPSTTTTYTLTITDASGCTATTTHTVNVTSTPAVAVTGPSSMCPGGSVTLTATAGFVGYLWQPGNLTGQSITVSPGADTTYTVTATAAGGCTATTTHTVTLAPAPPPASITATGPTTFCTGGSVVLTASAGASYLWSPNGETTQSITVGAAGSYGVVVTYGSGCTATAPPVTVTVNPNPTVTITGPTATCDAAAVTLDAGPGFTSYLWQPGNLSGQTITVSPSSTTTYTVTATNASGCSATDNHTVAVSSNPVAAITAPTAVCSGTTGHAASVGAVAGATYAWTITNGIITSGAGTTAITFQPTGLANVLLGVTVTAGSCTATGNATVQVSQAATPSITAPASVNASTSGHAASITPQAGATYAWSITGGSITGPANGPAITFSSGTTTPITLSVSVNVNGCIASASTTVIVNGVQPPTDEADLSVAKTAPATATAGGTLTYTIDVTNAGPSEALNLTLADTLPAGVVVQSFNAGAWSCGTIAGQFNCSLPSMAAGGFSTITLTVLTPSQPTTLVNTVAVASAIADPVTANDTDSAATSIVVAPPACPAAPPSLITPASGATGVASPVTLSWSSVAGAVSYDIWTTTNGTTTLAGATTSTTFTVSVGSGDTSWYVVAHGNAGCQAMTSAARTFTVPPSSTCVNAAKPQVTAPSGSVASSPVAFSWTPVPQAIGYRVWISVDGTALQDVGATNGPISLTADVPAGAIVAFVDALFNGCPPSRSEGHAFTVTAPDLCAGRTAASLSAPANNATVNSSSVDLAWAASAATNGQLPEYRVWASEDGGPFEVRGTTTETSLRDLFERGTVVWYVQTLYDGCPALESTRFTFTIPPRANCGTSRAVPVAPNGTVAAGNVTFAWTAAADAIGYELYLALGNETPSLVATLPAGATTFNYIVPEGTLSWFVRAMFDRCPSRDSQTATFVYDAPDACAANDRPQAIAPLAGPAIASPVRFAWSASAGATRYDLYVQRPGAAPSLVASTTATEVAAVALENGAHDWFVRAFFNGCSPLDSAPERILVVTPPAACADLLPPVVTAPGQISSGAEFLIQWTAVAGANSYQLQLASTADFAGADTITTTATQHALVRTNNGTTPIAVYARARAIDSRCMPVPTVTPYGPISAVFVLPKSGGEGSAPLTKKANVAFTIDLGPELAGQTFVATPNQPWLTVDPASGVVPAAGRTLVVTADTADLAVGSNLGAVTVTLNTPSAKISTTGVTSVTSTVSVSLVTPVTPATKNTPPPDALVIPAVANASGINSKFQSDVRVSNTSAQVMKYQLTFTPTGDTGVTKGSQTTFSIEPGRTVALDDILKSWFGTGTTSATGMLEVRPLTQTAATTPNVPVGALANLVTFASSRTFNVTSSGTFGQHIPAVPFANFIGKGANALSSTSLSLQQIAQSDQYRTNLGLVEGSGEPAQLLVKVFGSTGLPLAQFPVNLNGGQHLQMNGVLAQQGITNLTDGRVEVSVTGGNGKVTAYASVLDNQTSDPLLVSPVTLADTGNTRWVVPGVADLNNGVANWQTDLRVFNAGTADVQATLSFYSQNGGAPKTATMTIPAGQVQILDKTLATVFGATNDGGAVHITTNEGARLIATARTYNLTTQGTYGQFISAVTPAEAAALGTRPLQLLQVEESNRFRSNIGLAEVTGNPVKLELSVIPPDAKFTAVAEVTLAPNEFRQIGSLLRTVGLSDTYNARVTVRVIEGSGRVAAYASVIDALTNDPTYVPAQ